jgi:hypothetical protein
MLFSAHTCSPLTSMNTLLVVFDSDFNMIDYNAYASLVKLDFGLTEAEVLLLFGVKSIRSCPHSSGMPYLRFAI